MEQTPPMSINRKKIFIDELDVRTHLSCWPDAKDMGGTRTMLWREFSKCMQSASGFWWMDLHGGWFDSKEVMDEIKKIEAAAKDMRAEKREPTAQVLIVTDTESFHCAKPKAAPRLGCRYNRKNPHGGRPRRPLQALGFKKYRLVGI